MKPIEFPGHNVVMGKNQPEYLPLPALKMPDGEVITCWELTDEELEKVKESHRIYLSQLTFNRPLQPVKLMADLSDGITFITEETP